jgi:peptidyl-prolyl cis-trans isomerase D
VAVPQRAPRCAVFEVDAERCHRPEPSDSELREFYEENPSLFEVPERRQIAIIHADPVEIGQRIEISEDALEAAYERRKDEFGTPERRVIQMIPFADAEEAAQRWSASASGAQFLDIAREKGLSEDDATLGELTREELPDPAFAEAAFALDEGEVSEPVEGRLSTALLRVTDIIPADQQPLSEVRDELTRQLQTERGREEVLDFYDEIEDGRAGGQSFEEVAANLDLTVRTVEVDRSGVDAEGETADLPASDEVLRTAFDLDVGLEADPVSTPDDGFVWVDVRDITPASRQAVRRSQRRGARRLEAAPDERGGAREGARTQATGRSRHAAGGPGAPGRRQVQTVTDIARGSQQENFGRDAVEALFAAPADGYAVALARGRRERQGDQVLARAGPAFDPNSEEATQIATAVEAGLSDDLTVQYVSALQSSLEVQLNEELWQRISTGRI